jgi:predicted AAA+ superfamily ATPase
MSKQKLSKSAIFENIVQEHIIENLRKYYFKNAYEIDIK